MNLEDIEKIYEEGVGTRGKPMEPKDYGVENLLVIGGLVVFTDMINSTFNLESGSKELRKHLVVFGGYMVGYLGYNLNKYRQELKK